MFVTLSCVEDNAVLGDHCSSYLEPPLSGIPTELGQLYSCERIIMCIQFFHVPVVKNVNSVQDIYSILHLGGKKSFSFSEYKCHICLAETGGSS